MHEEGFKKALTNVVNRYARAKNLLKEKDDEPPRRGHPRGPHRDHLGEAARPAVRGPDQGQARQHRDAVARARRPPTRSSADWLEEHPTEANKIVKKAHRRRRGPAWRPRQARDAHPPQVAARRRRHARQARRLLVARTASECELFIVEGDWPAARPIKAPRPAHPGDPADPRQDPQRRAGPPRQDAQERRDPGAHLRHRRRARRGVRRREAPLPQDHHDGRRRRRRLPHPHAAAHVLLPADAPSSSSTGTSTSRSRRCTRTEVGKEKIYLKDDARQGARSWPSNPNHKIEFSRLKGLGEMDWQELGETTMDAGRRTLLQVVVEQAAHRRRGRSRR